MSRVSMLLLLALAVAVPLSLLAGRVWIDPIHPPFANALVIVLELRAPRAALALVIGGGLGMAGAAMQGYLRNPLADPGLFGIAPAAALGAVLSLWLGAAGFVLGDLALPGFALVGAGGAMALLSLLAGRSGEGAGDSGVGLFTLAGMMLASLCGALMSLAISLSPSPFALSEIVTWLMGSLADCSWREVAIAGPLTAVGMMALGLAGALLLLVADCLCRLLPVAGGELRLGIALSLLGAPFFAGLLLRLRRGEL